MSVIDHDVHMHTVLSACCGDPELTVANAVARAAALGLKTLGISNHMWDSAVPGATDWYVSQDVEHVLQSRGQIPADTQGVRVLIGCETEYCGRSRIGISRAAVKRFDYVLVPISHLHMLGFTAPEQLMSPPEVARVMVQRFDEVLDLRLATGIAHPFLPLGYLDQVDEVLSYLKEPRLKELFAAAAELGVSQEISAAMFPQCMGKEKAGHHDESFLRILHLAKRAGCLFHFASDAHHLDNVGRVVKLEPVVQALGLKSQDIHPLFRSNGAGGA